MEEKMPQRFFALLLLMCLLSVDVAAQDEFEKIDMYQLAGKTIPKALLNDISVDFNEIPFELALNEISEKGNINLNFNREMLPLEQPVSMRLENVMVLEALLTVLKKTGTSLQITSNGVLAITANAQQTGGRRSTQKGKIVGQVVDKSTGAPLPGANVLLKGTSIGAATDINGEYVIFGVPPGHYTMQYKFIGYDDVEKPVYVSSGQKVSMNAEMEWSVVDGQEVTITAQAEGQLKAINQQLTSDAIINVVASDRIQELPDANAAESVGRLPGVSIKRNAGEGQKVVIRGLSPKYSSITLNGMRIPSVNTSTTVGTDDRSLDLSMMSSDNLAGIELYKALTPDMDADAIGGTVNFVLKKASKLESADKTLLPFSTKLKYYGGYNDLESDFGNFKGIVEIERRFFDNKFGIIGSINYEKANRASDKFSATYNLVPGGEINPETGMYPIETIGMTLTDRLETRKRWGTNLMLDYELSNGILQFANFFSHTSRDQVSRAKSFDLEDKELGISLSDDEIHAEVWSSMFSGKHSFWGMEMDWGASYFRSKRDSPFRTDLKLVEFSAFTSDVDKSVPAEEIPNFLKNNTDNQNLNKASFSSDNSLENSVDAQFNFKLPFNLDQKIGGYLEWGGKLRYKDRSREVNTMAQNYYYLGSGYVEDAVNNHPTDLILHNGLINIANFLDDGYNPGEFLNGDYEFSPILGRQQVRDWYTYHQSEYWPDERVREDEYDIQEMISAGYLMAKVNFGQTLSILPGVRYERSDNQYQAVYIKGSGKYGETQTYKDTTTSPKTAYWLPHFHIKYKPLKWFDIRFALTRTLSRPNFSWISPYMVIKTSQQSIKRGSPELMPARSLNYDLFLSFFNNQLGLLTLGAFYKDIQDISYIYKTYLVNDEDAAAAGLAGYRGYSLTTPVNSEDSKVWGFEMDLQTNLRFLPGIFKGFVLNINYAHFYSETVIPFTEVNTYFDPQKFRYVVEYDKYTRKIRVPGQADDIFNFSIGYDIAGFSARISAVYQGESISSVANIQEEDDYTNDYLRWDTSVKQKVSKNISLFLNLVNFTSRPESAFQGYSGYQTKAEYFGMTGNIGIKVVF